MGKVNWQEKVIDKEVLELIGEKKMILNNIPRIKANWIDHILRINCLLHDVIERPMTK